MVLVVQWHAVQGEGVHFGVLEFTPMDFAVGVVSVECTLYYSV